MNRLSPYLAIVVNFLTLMVVYMLTRWVFFNMNASTFPDVTFSDLMTMSLGGLRFDISALCYLNIPYILLLCILHPSSFIFHLRPWPHLHSSFLPLFTKAIYLITNSLGIAANCADIVYFEFGQRRSTATIFSEFGGESNIGTIFLNSITAYWHVWLFGLAMIAAITVLYYQPHPRTRRPGGWGLVLSLFLSALTLTLTVAGLRGGLRLKMHPLRQDSATMYCSKPIEAAIVLNTPFTLITTAHKTDYKNPAFFPDEQLDGIFNPIHHPSSGMKNEGMKNANIVVFLMESFSAEYVADGYTPFLDSLMNASYSFRYSFANGLRSVDCMPATFAGIPRYVNPFCYYLYANNTLQGLPAMLAAEGYTTAFFHGAPNTTLGFKAFTNAIGFQRYYGMDEYANPSDFDGTWAIFDEPYLQYFADKSNEIAREGKPFMITVFTASSHEPFTIPSQHKGTFVHGQIPMHNAISYADYAIRRYFERVKDEPWMRNTIFVLTADHTGPAYRPDYNNNMGRFLIPIFFYTPGGQLPARCDTTRLMQQTDITPTILSLLNYQKPYFSFGKDIFNTSPAFVNYVFNDRNGDSMYYLDDLMIEYHDNSLIGIYKFKQDPTLRNNLIQDKGQFPQLPFMEQQMQAILQQYVTRMKENRLTAQ